VAAVTSGGPTDALAPGGALSKALPDYEDRPEQRAMAEAVTRALDEERPLLVEAGTGTGKTLAYLMPAVLSGRRVVVSTGTRTLQEQIVRHDLDVLRQLLDRPISAVTLKGVGNYLCRRKLDELEALAPGDRETGDADLDRIRAWAVSTTRGDRAEVEGVADTAAAWERVTTTTEGRIGPRCPHYERCFVTRARRAADEADIVIVNHHLFFADLALRTAFEGARVLPHYEAVVFDEAHQIEDVATSYFGIAVSTRRLTGLVRDATRALCRPAGPAVRSGEAPRRLVEHVDRTWREFFDRVRSALREAAASETAQPLVLRTADSRPRHEGRMPIPPGLFDGNAVREAWFRGDAALEELGAHARLAATGDDGSLADDDREDLLSLARRAQQIRDDVAALAEPDSDDATRYVHWAELRPGAVALKASPIEVGPLLSEHLFERVGPVVMTSATLAIGAPGADDAEERGAPSFGYVRHRLGLDAVEPLELRVESPFDYASQALLYLPTDLPEPGADVFGPASWRRVRECLAITEGRAFLLFTTHRALQAAARHLAPRLDYPVLIQGQQSREALLASFRARPGSVLLGTGAFWEGVDMPGEALSQVIIDKLPFAPPDDPLVAARSRALAERGLDPFAELSVPQAALALKQGFGRLIRRRQDRGIVTILDRRVLSRRYGQQFVATLPGDVPRTSSIEQARRWWSRS